MWFTRPTHTIHIQTILFLVEVEMLDDDTDKKVISIPLLNMTYKLVQFHFHWSQDDKDGSEHAIFNEHFPLEVEMRSNFRCYKSIEFIFFVQMHLVHVEEGVTFDEALSEPFGLLVLSVFFKLGKQNSELLKLTNKFDQIEDPLKSTVLKNYCMNFNVCTVNYVNRQLDYCTKH